MTKPYDYRTIEAMKFFSFIYILLSVSLSYSSEICSRIARINYQEVLVDAGDGRKGEGLRFYLEKDLSAKRLLDKYQETNTPSAWSVASSTVGSLLILTGLLQTGDSDASSQKDTLLFGGAAIIAVNYLINKTISQGSEDTLNKAIEQYNKRNSPKIYFNPYLDNDNNIGASAGITTGF